MKKRILDNYSAEAELNRLKDIATRVFSLKIGSVIKSGSEANMVGIRSKTLLVSHRIDSRTFIIHDENYGVGKRAGYFKGADKEQFMMCRQILTGLNIPLSEVKGGTVLVENLQAAHIDRENGQIHIERAKQGRKTVKLSRKIKGVNVWSSNLVLGLTRLKQVGFMQLHWPEIPKWVIDEALRMQYEIEHGWRPSNQPQAEIESIEAGIVHSPAIGLIMDIYPSIRVIYSSLNKGIGKKQVLHLDRHGRPIPIPRQAVLPIESYQQREAMQRPKP